MKTLNILLIFILTSFTLLGQHQLDIQGDPNSTETVANIRVNSTATVNLIGLDVHSEPVSHFGVGGRFYGGRTGIIGQSNPGVGVYGSSTSGFGVHGQSSSGTGGVFKGGGGVAIELVGVDSKWGEDQDDGVIRSEAFLPGSDLILVSNDVLSFHLDDDNNNNNSVMWVFNGHDKINPIFKLDESGNLTLAGSCSCSSDINRKEKFTSVNTKEILEKISVLPILEWQFIGENTRHLGPMAQDFYTAFSLGADETTIGTIDANGIALAAIQALKAENDALKQENKEIKALIVEVNKRLERIEKRR